MRLLEQHGISYQVQAYTYDPDNLDLRLIATANQLDLATVYKTLVLKGEPDGLLVAMVAGTHELDLKSLARLSGNKRVAMLPPANLQAKTGYIRGGCSPLGMKKAYPLFLDETVSQHERIWFNAGIRGLLIQVEVQALIEMTEGTVAAIGRPFPG